MGKFPIGTTGGYAYMDIKSALQHFIQTAAAKANNPIPNIAQEVKRIKLP